MQRARHVVSVAAITFAAYASGMGSARADESGAPQPTFEYEASGRGCPTDAVYRAEARKRVPERTENARTLRVRLGPSVRGFDGTVEAVEIRTGTPRIVATRTVEGATCAEVADATLLLVALGVVEASEPGAPAESPPSAPAVPPKAERPLAAEKPAPSNLAPTLHVAGLAVVGAGLGPIAAGGGARLGAGLEREGLFRPEARVGIDVIAGARLSNAAGTATRSLVAARLDLCPLAFGRRALSVRVCAAGALGEVRVRGENVTDPRDEGRRYAALGGLARARARIVAGLHAELAAGVLAPLEPHRFFVEPDATLLRLDGPVPFVEGGLAWSIP